MNQWKPVSSVLVQEYLSGLDYPATKQDIVGYADTQGAPEDVLMVLTQLPEQDYVGPDGVSEAIEEV